MPDDPSDNPRGDLLLGAARIFAGWYQIVVCSDPDGFRDEDNWTEEAVRRGFAGGPTYRMIGTDADLNDHWVELVASVTPPDLDAWDRVICCYLFCTDGHVGVGSVIERAPSIPATIPPGDYSIYAAARNLGVDRQVLGEDRDISDAELATRKDIEWYRIFLIPGVPEREGRLKDSISARDLAGTGPATH